MCVPDWIRRHAAVQPERVAAVDSRTVLTYADLDRRAESLANVLVQNGVGIERVVGICMAPCVELVMAIVAVWRSGAAYVAIDPTWPALRQLELLHETRSELLLLDASSAATFTGTSPRPIRVDAATPPADARLDLPPPAPASLAYVLYTSGSTGRPKGVMIEHRQLAAYVSAANDEYGFPDRGQFLLSSTFAADLGHTPIFCGLCSGGTVHLVPSTMTTDAAALATYIATHRIDVMKIVPSHLMTLISSVDNPGQLMPRTHVVLGGEPLHQEAADVLRRLAPGVTVINEYGPTETTVGVLAGRADQPVAPEARTVPAGKALRGAAVYVMRDRLEQPSPNVTGELYVGGDTVGRGYWNDPRLTAERFLPDPFASGGRVYRTGDTSHVLADGTFEIVGRSDQQVKIRGFRVEPTEVEASLLACTNVRAAVVEAERHEGVVLLVAYVAVADDEVDGVRERVLREIAARVPAAMVPATIVTMRDMPLTRNGKVDRERLRSLPRTSAPAYVAPETEIERDLATIWSQVLKVEIVGRHDSFFRLGGDSILMIKAAALATRRGYQINARLMFKHPVLSDLARAVVRTPAAAGSTESTVSAR